MFYTGSPLYHHEGVAATIGLAAADQVNDPYGESLLQLQANTLTQVDDPFGEPLLQL